LQDLEADSDDESAADAVVAELRPQGPRNGRLRGVKHRGARGLLAQDLAHQQRGLAHQRRGRNAVGIQGFFVHLLGVLGEQEHALELRLAMPRLMIMIMIMIPFFFFFFSFRR
jgi:hypothetical protein